MGGKTAYQEMREAQLREWEDKLDELKAKASKVKAEARVLFQEDVEELQAKCERVRSMLDELGGTADGAWEDVKHGVESAWEEMRLAFHRAAAHFT